MNRSTTHQAKYKAEITQCEKPEKRLLGGSSEESECEEIHCSSFRFAEDSESFGGWRFPHDGREWNTVGGTLVRQKAFCNTDKPKQTIVHSYFTDTSTQKKDKITQKNFVSPLPSFLRPPIYREVPSTTKQKLPTVKSSRNAESTTSPPGTMPKKISSRRGDFGLETETICYHHHHQQDVFEQNQSEKRKADTESQLILSRPKIVSKSNTGNTTPNRSKATVDSVENWKNSTDVTTTTLAATTKTSGNRTGSSRESEVPCAECIKMDCCEKSKTQQVEIKRSDSEKELKVYDSFLPNFSFDSKNMSKNDCNGKVREKLVYVVEEDGTGVTKMETDLFTVNEILAIKRDLVELSEFAKKLKKLKEMRKKETMETRTSCHCKSAKELLKDVNRRIVTLEARQEELERASCKSGKKGETETESKKTDDQKTTSYASPKTGLMTKQSAMTSVPSFPKTEMIVSRAEGCSNNSEIVNELMDIKTQLLRLEKRRMSKELSPEAVPLSSSNLAKTKGHAIAVYSSKTYILTSENCDRERAEIKDTMSIGKKAKDSVDLLGCRIPIGKDRLNNDEPKESKMDSTKAKDNVANWLKTVPSIEETSCKEVKVIMTSEISGEKNEKEPDKKEERKSRVRCQTCHRFVRDQDFNIQEPKKNRESDTEFGDDEIKPKNEKPNKEDDFEFECKGCYLTRSGRIFALELKPPLNVAKDYLRKRDGIPHAPPKILRRSVSSCSTPSVIYTKEQVKRMSQNWKKQKTKNKLCVPGMMSKSMQELSSSSTVTKRDKTAVNTRTKSFRKNISSKEKIIKENKNKLVKRKLDAKKSKKIFERGDSPDSSCGRSELISSIDLNAPPRDNPNPFKEDNNCVQNIYSVTNLTKKDFKNLMEKCCEKKNDQKKTKKEKKSECKKHQEKSGRKHEKQSKAEKSNQNKKEKKMCSVKKKKNPKSTETKGNKKCKENKTAVHMVYTALADNNRPNDYHFKSKDVLRMTRTPRNKQYQCYYYQNNYNDGCIQRCGEIQDVCCTKKRKKKENLKYCDDTKKRARRKCSETDVCLSDCTRCANYCDVKSQSCQQIRPCVSSCVLSKSEGKPEEEICTLRTFFRNIRSLYPRFSNLQFLPWLGYCDKKSDKEEENKNCLKTNDLECARNSSCCIDQRCHRPNCRRRCYYYYPAQCTDDLKNCRCVKVYLQTQAQKDWPGSRPFKKLPSEENISYESVSKSTIISCEYKESRENLIFPQRKSQLYYVEHCKEEKHKEEKHKKKKHKEEKSEKTHKKCTKNCKCNTKEKKKKQDDKCVCNKCGNVHRRKKQKQKEKDKEKKKKKKKSESSSACPTDSESSCRSECCCEKKPSHEKKPYPEEKHPRCVEKHSPTVDRKHHGAEGHPEEPGQPSPFMSFWKGICSTKHKEKGPAKSKSSILSKLNEVRYMKTCKKKPRKKKKLSLQSLNKEQHPKFACRYSPENFISCSCPGNESEKTDNTDNTGNTENTEGAENTENTENENSEKTGGSESTVCEKCECQIQEIMERLKALERKTKHCKEKKEKQKKQKKKKEKKEKCCDCGKEEKKHCPEEKSHSSEDKNDEVQAYYCACLKQESGPFAALTTSTDEKSSSGLNQNRPYECPKKEWKLREKLSSLNSLLRNFGKKKNSSDPQSSTSKNQESFEEPVNDCTSPLLQTKTIYAMTEEPVYLMKRESRKKSKKKKEKEPCKSRK